MILQGTDTHTVREVQQAFIARVPQVINDRLMGAIFHYHRLSPRFNLPWTIPLMQSVHEADYMRSQICVDFNNYAGIKGGDQRDGYRAYPTPEEGILDHLSLLAVYAGVWVPDMLDPTRNTRLPAIIQGYLGHYPCVTLDDLNGIWAYPGTNYGENIMNVWKKILG